MEVKAHLERVLKSTRFRDSQRACAFLRFVVEKSLAGESDQIKETVVGMEVFGRGTDFNPQIDSIVRVEAGRLRSKLRDYYLGEGREEELRIELPRGSYVPVIERAESGAPVTLTPVPEAAAPRRTWWVWLVAAAGLMGVAWGLWSLQKSGGGQVAGQRKLAVLPFADLSEKHDMAYFCDGLAEEMIDDLSRVPGLVVMARGSTFQFRGEGVTAQDVGRKLGVERVLLGSVRRSGRKVRVSAQLVDAANGTALWTSSFDRDSSDALAVQDEIAREVARALQVQMAVGGSESRAAVDPAAYDLYLKGRYYYWRSTAEDEERALALFEEAAKLAPNFAAAWAGIADVLASTPLRGIKLEQTLIDRARMAARRALELDPRSVDALLAEAHMARTMDYDWRQSEMMYRRALALQPGAARPHNSYGVLLSLAGRFSEADRELREAARLDPLSMQVKTNLVLNLYREKRFAEAVEQAREAASIDPAYRNILSPMAAALAEAGRTAEALETLKRLEEKAGGELSDNHLGLKGYILARAGRRGEALAVRMELEKRGAARYVPRSALADVALGLGEKDKALGYMEEGLKQREILLAGLLVSPHSEPVRSEARFRALKAAIARQ